MDFNRHFVYALRTLRKTPAFSIMTTAILALGIGAHTTMFSIVQAVLLRALPYDRPDQLVWAWSVRPDNRGGFNVPDFIDYRDRNRSLGSIAAFAEVYGNITGQGEPVRLQGVQVSGNFFDVLGTKAALGRTLQPEDDRAGSTAVTILSHAAWQTRLGGDPGIIGRKLMLDGTPYTVVGVLPREFLFPRSNAAYAVPLSPDNDPARARRVSINRLRVIGRLKPGVSLQQAEGELTSIASQLRAEYPVANSLKIGVHLVLLEQEVLGVARESLLIVVAAVSLLLLIVSVNVANSLIARAVQRRKEAAICAALGASHMQIVAQSVAENLLLAVCGGGLGFLLARTLLNLINRNMPDFPRAELAVVNGTAIWYAAALSAAIGLLTGLLPARQLTGNLVDALKSVSRGSSPDRQARLTRAALIVAEVALSFALLVGAGLLTRSLGLLNRVDSGFQPRRVLTVGVSLPRARYRDRESIQAFLDRAANGLASEPAVESHSVISILPISGTVSMAPFSRKDRPVTPDKRQFANYRFVAPDYFRTMGIPVESGREFSRGDKEDAAAVAIISNQFVRRYLGDTPALGAHLLVSDNDSGPREVEIIGVVGNVKQFGLNDEPSADLYIPLLQVPNEPNGFLTRPFNVVLRSLANPQQLSTTVKNHLLQAEPDAALTVRTMDEVVTGSLSIREFQSLLMTAFAVFAALLAGFGMYSVMSYLAAQRAQEMGIRIALGATSPRILWLVLRQGLSFAVLGIAAGAGLVAAGYRLIASKLYMTSIFDAFALGCSVCLVLLIAVMASWAPARRAIRVDVIAALREN